MLLPLDSSPKLSCPVLSCLPSSSSFASIRVIRGHIMMRGQTISFRNRQRARRINMRRLREIVLICLRDLLEVESFEIGIQIIAAEKMAQINEDYLQHRGSTDVITFDYLDRAKDGARRRPVSSQQNAKAIHGDIY